MFVLYLNRAAYGLNPLTGFPGDDLFVKLVLATLTGLVSYIELLNPEFFILLRNPLASAEF